MKALVLAIALLITTGAWAQTGVGGGGQTNVGGGSSSGGGVVGGSFGSSPSAGYTFTSTPITTNPFGGNLLVGTAINPTDNATYTQGAGWTLVPTCNTGTTIGLEYQTAGSASSYSAAFTIAPTHVWGGTITTFTATSPTFVQGKCAIGTTLAYTSNNAAGNLLYAVIRYATSTGPVTGVTCNGNTWKLAGLRGLEAGIKGVGDTAVQEIWYVANSNSGACTVTPAGVAGGTVEIAIAEFSGVATSSPLVDYNYNADGTGNTTTTNIAGATTNSQFLYQAVNNTTGVVDFSGRDHAVVFRNAAANLAAVGGQLFHKKGIYNGQSSLQEVNNGQTNWYVFGLPPTASGGGTQVYWDLVGETTSQASGNNQFGTIFQALPSAYSGPAPSSTLLSVLWQRPAPSAVNNSVIFRNMTCRIPDNQRSTSNCFDSLETQYSSHINTVADTTIPYTDQLCSGLTDAASTNTSGYRTNQAATNEAYFENTWSIGWYNAYTIISNHAIGINMHALCNHIAGIFQVTSSLYGSEFHHFQDIHNIQGPILNCTNAGTRIDFFNSIAEYPQSSNFQRVTAATETVPGNCVGKVDLTQGSSNGVSFNPIPFFATGSGANFRTNESTRLVQPGMLTSNFTSAATTGTTKQTLATYTFVYNTSGVGPALGPFQNNSGAVYRIKTWGITAANGNSKVFEIDFGGTAIATITSTASGGSVKCEAEIIVSSVANTQEVVGYCDDGATRTVTRTAPAITGNANIVTNIAATTATSSGDFTFKGLTIEYLGGS